MPRHRARGEIVEHDLLAVRRRSASPAAKPMSSAQPAIRGVQVKARHVAQRNGRIADQTLPLREEGRQPGDVIAHVGRQVERRRQSAVIQPGVETKARPSGAECRPARDARFET